MLFSLAFNSIFDSIYDATEIEQDVSELGIDERNVDPEFWIGNSVCKLQNAGHIRAALNLYSSSFQSRLFQLTFHSIFIILDSIYLLLDVFTMGLEHILGPLLC